MTQITSPTDPRAWGSHLQRIGANHGTFARVDPRHVTLFVEEGETLLLSFDRAETLCGEGAQRLPLGFDCVSALDFSLLSVICEGEACFQSIAVSDLLTTLAENGFFASYQQMVILAGGPESTQAALKAARSLPDARLLLVRPLVAPVPSCANAAPPFSIGPELLHRSAPTAILYDPSSRREAGRANLFKSSSTTHVPLPKSGAALERVMARTDVIVPLSRHLLDGTLDRETALSILTPALRRDPGYLARVAAA